MRKHTSYKHKFDLHKMTSNTKKVVISSALDINLKAKKIVNPQHI